MANVLRNVLWQAMKMLIMSAVDCLSFSFGFRYTHAHIHVPIRSTQHDNDKSPGDEIFCATQHGVHILYPIRWICVDNGEYFQVSHQFRYRCLLTPTIGTFAFYSRTLASRDGKCLDSVSLVFFFSRFLSLVSLIPVKHLEHGTECQIMSHRARPLLSIDAWLIFIWKFSKSFRMCKHIFIFCALLSLLFSRRPFLSSTWSVIVLLVHDFLFLFSCFVYFAFNFPSSFLSAFQPYFFFTFVALTKCVTIARFDYYFSLLYLPLCRSITAFLLSVYKRKRW